MARQFGQTQDTIDFVKLEAGADAAKVQALLTEGGRSAPSRPPKC